MSALIAGLDFSSKAIHAALISLDADDGSDAPPITLRSFLMPTWRGGTTPAFRSVERCRVVRNAMRELLRKVSFDVVFTGTDAEYLDQRKLCEGRTLEESSHYGGYVPCYEHANRVEHHFGRKISLCRRHTAEDAYPPKRDDAEVVHVCVEEPFGASRKADNVMRELYGAILASIPPHIERDTIGVGEWRRIIWPDGYEAIAPWGDPKLAAIGQFYRDTGLDASEHASEAYLIARACRARLDKAFAA